MPLVHECSATGCSTLTMGDYCLEHEQAESQPRRLLAVAAATVALAGFAAALLARHA